MKDHTHAATCISYISETGIPNILLYLRGPFRINSLCSVAIRSSFEAALTHTIDSERYEVLKNESVENANNLP